MHVCATVCVWSETPLAFGTLHTRRRQRNPSNLFAFLLQQQRSRWEALPHAEKYKKIHRAKKKTKKKIQINVC